VDPSLYRVSIITEFADYPTALAGDGVTITISDVGQPTIERTYEPGVCADEGMDWEYELLSGYVDGDRVPLLGHECRRGSETRTIVYD